MLGDLQSKGFDVVDDHDISDAIIVNTCAFVDDAKSESLEAILEAAQLRAVKDNKRLIVTGCLAQRYSDSLAEELPEVDAFVGFEQYASLPSHLHAALGTSFSEETGESDTSSARVRVGQATVPFRGEAQRFRLTPPHTAYLRVAEGCDHACSFCAIPGFRGKFRSKSWQSVVDEAKALVASGAKELNLIAEDTNQYGLDRCARAVLSTLRRPTAIVVNMNFSWILHYNSIRDMEFACGLFKRI
jgi:ribosomal protein S12 methylthiotransferase